MGVAFAKMLYAKDGQGFKAFCFGLMWVDGAWVHRRLHPNALGEFDMETKRQKLDGWTLYSRNY